MARISCLNLRVVPRVQVPTPVAGTGPKVTRLIPIAASPTSIVNLVINQSFLSVLPVFVKWALAKESLHCLPKVNSGKSPKPGPHKICTYFSQFVRPICLGLTNQLFMYHAVSQKFNQCDEHSRFSDMFSHRFPSTLVLPVPLGWQVDLCKSSCSRFPQIPQFFYEV